MNFLVIGNMGSGKDTFAKFLPDNFVQLSFAGKLKQVCKFIRGHKLFEANILLERLFDYDPPKHMMEHLKIFAMFPPEEGKDRNLLQIFGSDYARAHDKDVWVRGVKHELQYDTNYVITDCRFVNEFEAFPDWIRVFIDTPLEIRIKRIIARDGEWDNAWKLHKSELDISSLKSRCDFIIDNSGTLEDFQRQVEEIYRYVGEKDGK